MARKNIYDILGNMKLDVAREYWTLMKLFVDEKDIYIHGYDHSLKEYIDEEYFRSLEFRGTFTSIGDMMSVLKINPVSNDINDLFLLCEFLVALLLSKDIPEECQTYIHNIGMTISENIGRILNKVNYKIKEIEYNRFIIIEDKPEVTAVAEIVDEKTARSVLRYNHYALKGDIDAKKDIIRKLGDVLEPRRKELDKLNHELSQNLFNFLNTMNIRHNNIEKGKAYQPYVANMKEDELECWYDEIYQMILLAFLLLDNVERTEKAKVLTQNMEQARILENQK